MLLHLFWLYGRYVEFITEDLHNKCSLAIYSLPSSAHTVCMASSDHAPTIARSMAIQLQYYISIT